MTDFNDIKQKVLSTLGQAVDTTKDIASKAADKAKVSARIAKLTMEIAGENDSMKKTYIEIGKLYYDTHKDAPEGFFIQLCEEIAVAQKNIADKEAEIASLKAAEAECVDVDVEFEEVVAEEEAAADPGEPEPPAEPESPAEE